MNFMKYDGNYNTKFNLMLLCWPSLVSLLAVVNGAPTPCIHRPDILQQFEANHTSNRTQLWNPTILDNYHFKRIDHSDASDNQAQCELSALTRRTGLGSSSVTSEKSSCPWVEDIENRDFDPNRFPQYIPRITCICKSCIGYDNIQKDGKTVHLECEPVYNDRFVLYKNDDQSSDRCWKLGVARVPVGCACARPRTEKLDEEK